MFDAPRSLRLLLKSLLAVSLALTIANAIAADTAATAAATARSATKSPAPTVVAGRLLALNDFHGALEPPVGSSGLVNGTPAGGAEFLATHIKRLRAAAQATGEQVITVASGDLVGESPLLSAAFHDEPAVEVLSQLGLALSAAGDDEFAEGLAELRRLQRGGCHPVDGCQDGDGYGGARFRYLSANVVDRRNRLPVLLPADIRFVKGVPVGFVGITLRSTPTLVDPAGVQSVDFLDEVQAANFYADAFRLLGIRSLVLLIHQGGVQNPPPAAPDPSGCANLSGPITSIVSRLRPEFGIVVSGHTHRAYSCTLPNASGTSVVTSAGAFGTMVTSIGFTIDAKTKRFASVMAQNVIVENGIRAADGSWLRDAGGNFIRNPALVDPAAKQLVDKYRVAVAPLANRVVGSIAADITRNANAAGESPLGDVVADAQQAYANSAGAQIALVNPGGLRADLVFGNAPGGEAPGQVTYGEVYTVQPFNYLVVTQTFSGAQLKSVLEQQFIGFQGQTVQRILQVSASLSYTYNSTLPAGSRVSDLRLDGTAIDPAGSYRVATNSFIANGGDGFTTLTAGTERVTSPGFDIDALLTSLATSSPLAPGALNRITRQL